MPQSVTESQSPTTVARGAGVRELAAIRTAPELRLTLEPTAAESAFERQNAVCFLRELIRESWASPVILALKTAERFGLTWTLEQAGAIAIQEGL